MRTFVPVYRDSAGSACYDHVKYTSDDDGQNLIAHFRDGHARPSVFPTLAELSKAAVTDWRERFREV